jgi:hypothetical protein
VRMKADDKRSGAKIAPGFSTKYALKARLNHVTAGSHVLPVCNSTAWRASCFDAYGCACMPSSIKPPTGLISNASPTVSICLITVSPSESSVFPSSADTKYTTSATLCAPHAYVMHFLLFDFITDQAQDQVHEAGLGGELPGLHDGSEPGVDFLVGCHLVEKAAADEPDFAGVAHYRIAAVEGRRRHTVDCHVGWLVLDVPLLWNASSSSVLVINSDSPYNFRTAELAVASPAESYCVMLRDRVQAFGHMERGTRTLIPPASPGEKDLQCASMPDPRL